MKKQLTLMIALIMTSGAIFAQKTSIPMPPMVLIEGGTFTMGYAFGSTDERPAHPVTLNSFYIGKFEVTNKDFKKFVDATGYLTDAEQPDTFRLKRNLPPRGINNGTWRTTMNGTPVPELDSLKPVGNVSWFDAVAYLNWLSQETGREFRLPTEAEWEFAAKGGNKSKGYDFVGGSDLDEVAWYIGNSKGKSHTIGQKKANELGIYDMAGNAREWCSDWYGDTYYQTSEESNPKGPAMGTNRILRGGSWGSDTSGMRISYRNHDWPYNSALDFGFRPAIQGPAPVKKAEPAKNETNIMDALGTLGFVEIYGIYFDIGKARVKPESYPVVDQITKYLKENPTLRIVIEGHTDNTGSDAVNQPLSEKRAESIKAEIVKRGIDAGRVETNGYGASKPVADNKTAEGRTQNRRVTIKKL
jgi:formylglycine-generating enzyme